MDLQQELTRSSIVVTPRSRPEAARGQEAGATIVGPAVQTAPTTTRSTYLEPIRLSGPRGRRPVDRSLRAVDLVGAIVGLVLAAPVLLLAAIGIRATSHGPALYSQVRVGRDGRPFPCHKLRTMSDDAERQLDHLLDQPDYVAQWHRSRKLSDDPRVTPVGRFLRATDLDELPQLWNVLRGEMSLVGPRPVPAEEAERYGSHLATVLSVRPGMTGMWQVGGRHQVSYDERIALDVRYVEHRGVWTNLRLILRTVALIVVRRNGAS